MQSSTPSKPALLLTPTEASNALAISPRKLWGMTANGEVKHIRLGRCVRYHIEDLIELINDKKQGGQP
jgi:excisionase family DNA binding protein